MTRTGTRILLIAALLASLAVAALFATRAVGSSRRTHAGDEGIRPWMSIPYVAHSQGVSQRALWDALGIAPHLHDHRPLARIAREKKRRVEDLIRQLRGAIGAERKPAQGAPE
jgi:hypothetical protein